MTTSVDEAKPNEWNGIKYDSIHKPKHYTLGGIELKDVLEQRMSVVKDRADSWACWMQAVQYLWRWDAKGDPDENLAKAQELISFMRDALHKEKARGSSNG